MPEFLIAVWTVPQEQIELLRPQKIVRVEGKDEQDALFNWQERDGFPSYTKRMLCLRKMREVSRDAGWFQPVGMLGGWCESRGSLIEYVARFE